jgi:cell division protein FtsB
LGLRGKIAFLLGLAVAAGFLAYTLLGPGGGGRRAALQVEFDRLRGENLELRERNRRLVLEIEGLRQRRDVQEKAIREDLGLVKKDELIFEVLGAPDAGTPEATP